MPKIIATLEQLYHQIPRRHNDENIAAIESIITQYEDVLLEIEALNTTYEKNIGVYFDSIEEVKMVLKKAKDRKASKKMKDSFFDEASGILKDTIQDLIPMYTNGK
jgi:hypothetical protein